MLETANCVARHGAWAKDLGSEISGQRSRAKDLARRVWATSLGQEFGPGVWELSKDLGMSHAKLPNRFRVGHPRRFRLREVDPAETAGFSKENADRMLAKHTGPPPTGRSGSMPRTVGRCSSSCRAFGPVGGDRERPGAARSGLSQIRPGPLRGMRRMRKALEAD